jgi:hypothetical protein
MTIEAYTFRFKIENCMPNYSFYFKIKNKAIEKEMSTCSEKMKVIAKENAIKNRAKYLFKD